MQSRLNYMTPSAEVIHWTPEAALLQASQTDYGGVGIHNPNGDMKDFIWGD